MQTICTVLSTATAHFDIGVHSHECMGRNALEPKRKPHQWEDRLTETLSLVLTFSANQQQASELWNFPGIGWWHHLPIKSSEKNTRLVAQRHQETVPARFAASTSSSGIARTPIHKTLSR